MRATRTTWNVARWLRLGVLVVGCTLALGVLPTWDTASEARTPGAAAQAVSAQVEAPAPSGARHDDDLSSATSLRLGVGLGALLFAVLWFVGFRGSPIRAFPGLLFALYVGLAFGFERDVYPVSRFGMYARITSPQGQDPARLVARDQGGGLHTVQTFSDWRCDAPVAPLLEGCYERFGPFYYLPYVDEEDLAHIDRAGSPSGATQEVELVRAVWRLSGATGGIQRVDICPLVTCRVEVAP